MPFRLTPRLQSFMRSCQRRASWQNPRVLWQSIVWKVMSQRPWQHAWQWHGVAMAFQEACTIFEALNFKLIPCSSIVCYAWGRHLCWHLCKTLKLDDWRSTCNQKPGGTKSGKVCGQSWLFQSLLDFGVQNRLISDWWKDYRNRLHFEDSIYIIYFIIYIYYIHQRGYLCRHCRTISRIFIVHIYLHMRMI